MRKYEMTGLREQLGLENIFPSVRAAVDAIAPQDAPEGPQAGPGGSVDQSYREYFQRQQQKNSNSPRADSDG